MHYSFMKFIGGYSVAVPGAITPTPESWLWPVWFGTDGIGQPLQDRPRHMVRVLKARVTVKTVIHEREEMRKQVKGCEL